MDCVVSAPVAIRAPGPGCPGVILERGATPRQNKVLQRRAPHQPPSGAPEHREGTREGTGGPAPPRNTGSCLPLGSSYLCTITAMHCGDLHLHHLGPVWTPGLPSLSTTRRGKAASLSKHAEPCPPASTATCTPGHWQPCRTPQPSVPWQTQGAGPQLPC